MSNRQTQTLTPPPLPGEATDMPNTVDPRVDHLADRITGAERNISNLTANVDKLATMVEKGFDSSRAMVETSFNRLQSEIREINRTQVSSAKPNYNAIGVAFAICGTLLLWFVSSKTDPILEMQKAETEARRAADSKHEQQRTEDLDRQNAINSKMFDEQNRLRERMSSMEAWEAARKLWVDAKGE